MRAGRGEQGVLASHERGMQWWLRAARTGSGAGCGEPATSRERHDSSVTAAQSTVVGTSVAAQHRDVATSSAAARAGQGFGPLIFFYISSILLLQHRDFDRFGFN